MFGGCAEDYEAHIELLPSIAPVFYAFTDLQTQWNIIPMGGVAGLIYSSIPVVLEMHGITDRAQAFKDIRAMESAALPVLNRNPEGQENGG